MTRDDIVDFVCSKMAQTDATSKAVCADFVNRRYQMIYDRENWVDAKIGTDVAVVSGTNVYNLPTTVERIMMMNLSDGTLIEPIDYVFLVNSYPELVNGVGRPRYYLEYVNTGVHQYQLFPKPDNNYTIKLYGKRPFAELGATDTPVLRNIDNALIAFVYADMLQRSRQFQKAQMVVEEASAALQLMLDVEKVRANQPRQSRNMTVSGDSLAEMTDAVSCRIGDYSPPTRIVIQEFLRRNYMELYDSQLWPESILIAQVQRDGSEVVLPEYVDRVIAVRQNPTAPGLTAAEQVMYFNAYPQIFEQTGTPSFFNVLTSVGVAVLPPQNEEIQFVSTDDNDTAVNIFVRGETGGVMVSEAVTLNGQTPVRTKYTYDTPITVAKGLSAGTVTATGFVSQQFLVQLLPEERERKHVRIWLQPTPQDGDGNVCLLMGKRTIKPLVADEDTPILRGLGTSLINMTVADMQDRAGNMDAAKMTREKAAQSVQTVIDREMKQTAYEPRIIPMAEQIYIPA